jgi:hypothetical protein
LVSTIPPDCVLAESLTKGQQASLSGIQTSAKSSTDGELLTMTVSAGSVKSPDQRSDDCFEITSTVADDACAASNSPQPSAVQEQQVADVAMATAMHYDEPNSRVDETAGSQEVVETVVGVQRQEHEHSSQVEGLSSRVTATATAASTTTTTTTTASATLSSVNSLVQTNSAATALSRPKPKKSLETVISLLKRPVSTDSSSLSQSVVDRMLSSLSSSADRTELRADVNSSCPLANGNRDVAASSTHSPAVMPSDNCQRRTSVQPSMTSSSSQTHADLRSSSAINTSCATSSADFSPSIKRLTNMCINMSPNSPTPWQPEMGLIAQRPHWASFCQPSVGPLRGSWMTPTERFRQDTVPLELTTRDRKQHPVRQQSPCLGRSAVESHVRPAAAAAECRLNASSQPQFTNRGWRL